MTENEEQNADSNLSFNGTGGLMPHVEALIFASDKPLASAEITDLINQAFSFMDEKVDVLQIDAAIEGIVEKYSSEFYPFEVKQSGGGWQFLTKKDYHKTVAQLNGEKFLKRLSTAALETLAIIAYKHPVTKGEIESIRGVSSDYAVQKLLEKELIVITGRNEKMPGHPLVYATSKNFMDYFGINTADDLPKIKEVLAEQLVQPTVVNHTDFEQSEILAVADNGKLISADETKPESETYVNGHSLEEHFEDPSAKDESEPVTEETPTETLEDEMAEEEYITDEIFAAEDEAITSDDIDEEANDDAPNEGPDDETSKTKDDRPQ